MLSSTLYRSTIGHAGLCHGFKLIPTRGFSLIGLQQFQFTSYKLKKHDAKELTPTQVRLQKRKDLVKQGPKKPSSPFVLFFSSIRESLYAQYPNSRMSELSKIAGEKWRSFGDADKQKFYDAYNERLSEYKSLREQYEKTLPPKKPAGPFIQYNKKFRPIISKQHPELDLIEVTKLVGEKWNSLPQNEKDEWIQLYKTQLKDWEKAYSNI